MKTNKISVVLITIIIFLSLSNVLAYQGNTSWWWNQWSGWNWSSWDWSGWDWSGWNSVNSNGSSTSVWQEDWDNDWIINKDDPDFKLHLNININSVDTNNNWIPDWLEDWDNDWIINKDDPDFKLHLNMKYNDWEWSSTGNIINIWNENHNRNQAWIRERNQVASQLSLQNIWRINQLMNMFNNNNKNKNKTQLRLMYNILIKNIDTLIQQKQNSNLSQARKEYLIHSLNFLKVLTQKKLLELEE